MLSANGNLSEGLAKSQNPLSRLFFKYDNQNHYWQVFPAMGYLHTAMQNFNTFQSTPPQGT